MDDVDVNSALQSVFGEFFIVKKKFQRLDLWVFISGQKGTVKECPLNKYKGLITCDIMIGQTCDLMVM